MTSLTTQAVEGAGGVRMAVHRMGAGRPVLLLHGLFSSAQMNWVRYGHAEKLVEAGFEAIMPDLRAHGESASPHDPQAYPADVLVQDTKALVEHLDLVDYDLVGFSLGARTAARAVIEGLTPRRLVLAGMGIEGLSNWRKRSAVFVDAIARFDEVQRGEPAYFPVQFMKTMKIDREAARLLLGSVQDIDPADLTEITMPTLVLAGEDDHDNGSPGELANSLPQARLEQIPGNHMGCVTKPHLGRAIGAFLSA